MKASEGKLGRIFLLRLEDGDKPAETIERFAAENGIAAGQVFVMAEKAFVGIIAPDADARPGLRFRGDHPQEGEFWKDAEIVVQELLGMTFRRVKDTAGRETLTKVASTKTRVMEKPSPAPEEAGPGTIPVYLFNAEFN